MRELDLEATMRAVQILDESGKIPVIKDCIIKNGGKIDSPVILNIGVEILTGACGKKTADETAELLAYVFEKTPEEIKKTPLKELFPMFKELAEKNNLQVFLKTCMS